MFLAYIIFLFLLNACEEEESKCGHVYLGIQVHVGLRRQGVIS
jgi:hypothetical protein